jgi:hypothetical protein
LNQIKRNALKFREVIRENQASLVDEVRRKMRTGLAPQRSVGTLIYFYFFGHKSLEKLAIAHRNLIPSYAKFMLEKRERFSELDDEEFNGAPGSLFNAGVDTTSSTLQSFILAMILNPEVQKRAHEEVDRAVGSDRSPMWEDEAQLPYVCVSADCLTQNDEREW